MGSSSTNLGMFRNLLPSRASRVRLVRDLNESGRRSSRLWHNSSDRKSVKVPITGWITRRICYIRPSCGCDIGNALSLLTSFFAVVSKKIRGRAVREQPLSHPLFSFRIYATTPLAGDILRKNARFIAIAHHLMQDVPSSPAWAASPYDV